MSNARRITAPLAQRDTEARFDRELHGARRPATSDDEVSDVRATTPEQRADHFLREPDARESDRSERATTPRVRHGGKSTATLGQSMLLKKLDGGMSRADLVIACRRRGVEVTVQAIGQLCTKGRTREPRLRLAIALRDAIGIPVDAWVTIENALSRKSGKVDL